MNRKRMSGRILNLIKCIIAHQYYQFIFTYRKRTCLVCLTTIIDENDDEECLRTQSMQHIISNL